MKLGQPSYKPQNPFHRDVQQKRIARKPTFLERRKARRDSAALPAFLRKQAE